MADDYMDAHMWRVPKIWTTSPGAAEIGTQQTEPGEVNPHRHEFIGDVTGMPVFDELLTLRCHRAKLSTLLVDVLAAMEEMNSALNQPATGGRHPQAKEYHRAVMRAVKKEVKREQA